ncbi:MAG: hypothetical protein IT292_00375 [Deltaproteobacteria bacterium]|nr:hypothetical protein [Deltaproteobacteria bacterium]
MRILAFLTDMPPLTGFPSSGTAVRTFGLIQGLRSLSHEVIACPPLDAIHGFENRFANSPGYSLVREDFNDLKSRGFNPDNQAQLIRQFNPDLIFCGHWTAMMLQTKPRIPIVIDLAGPYLLERHYLGIKDHKGAVLAKLRVMSLADKFIVSGKSQEQYFYSFMKRAGIYDAQDRTCTISMPLSPDLPRKDFHQSHYPHFIFGGVFLPWQDPTWSLLRLTKRLVDAGKGKLSLIGGAHPNYPVTDRRYNELFSSLEKLPTVNRKPMLPFSEFIKELGDAHVAIDNMDWNLERQLAVTIRTTTYLWAGLPVIYNNYADLGALISKFDAGWLVAPGDEEALDNVFDEIYSNPEIVSKKSTNARILAAAEFSWEKAIKPLASLLDNLSTASFHETDIIIESKEADTYPIYGGRTVRQYFQCRVPNLKRVECLLNGRSRNTGTSLNISLAEVTGEGQSISKEKLPNSPSRIIAKRELSATELAANEWFSLDFPTLADSAGKFFCLELFSLNQAKSDLQLVSPWVMKSNPYPMLDLYYAQNLIRNSSLCMRTIAG